MEDNNVKTQHRSGGLYAKVNMSVKSANIMVASLLALLIVTSVFIVRHSGFTVKFDTDGGSHIDSVKAMYSDTVSVDAPVKEGYKFTGTQKWDTDNNSVSGSMTLYAGWESSD